MLQLFKFCCVGATSTVISLSIFWVLLTFTSLPWYISQTIAFCFGVTNGFFLNRIWTFQAKEHGRVRTQYPKFFISNAIGLVLNLSITKIFLIVFTGQLVLKQNAEPKIQIMANLCATFFVVIWNFTAARFWTFKAPPPSESVEKTPAATIASPK